MMGININDSTQDFTGQILRGEKTIETRNTRSLDPYIGERVGLVRTGVGKATLVGYATVGEPVVYDSVAKFRRDYDKHLVAPGSAFDIKDGVKYGYPLMQVEEITPREVQSKGIVARKVNPYTKPDLRERLKRKIMAGDRGGRPGEWSARKAQLLASEYEKAGGGYTGGRSKAQRSLSKWTKQDWRTKSGKPSLETGERYLPAAAISALSSAEYAASTRAKRSARGQFSKQPKRIAMKTRRYRNPATSEDMPGPFLRQGSSRDPIPPQRTSPQIDTPAFRKWFDGSVVTTRDGKPRMMYHGTGWTNLREFRSQRARGQIAGFFAFDPGFAQDFALIYGPEGWVGEEEDDLGVKKAASIYPVYLSLKKVFDVRKQEDRDVINFKEAPTGLNGSKGWDWTQLEEPRYVRRMKEQGFDGYIDFEKGSNSDPTGIAVFDPRNVKSAYGNRGTFDPADPNIINPKKQIKRRLKKNPLSYPQDQVSAAHIGPANSDINAAKVLWDTPAFKKWFGESKVRDASRRPMVVYHGTCASGFTKFDPTKTREMGFHFGTLPQARDFLKGCGTYRGSSPGIYPVYLSIQNPLFTPDAYSEDPIYFIQWLEKSNHIHEWFPDEDDNYYRSMNRLRDQMASIKADPTLTGADQRKLLEPIRKATWGLLRKVVTRKGYDGIRYRNDNEGLTGEASNIAWIAFSPAQVKSATDNRGTFNRRDPELRNPRRSMIRSKLSRIIEPGDRILDYDRAQGEDLYRLWDLVHTDMPLNSEALTEIEGLLDDDGVLVIQSGEEPSGLRDHFRRATRYNGMLLVQGPLNPEEARINTEKLRRDLE